MSFIAEVVISKVIDYCVDTSCIKIKEANKKAKEYNLQTRIYQMIIDAINKLTNDEYKNKDVLFNTAENLLNNFNRENDRTEAIRKGLSGLTFFASNDQCEDFKEALYGEICKEKNFDIYKVILLTLLEKEKEYNYVELQQIKELLGKINDYFNKNENKKNHQELISRTQEYADKWNDNMFLNNFDKRDENPGVNIKLREVYLDEHVPHYIWKDSKLPRGDLKKLLKEYIIENTEKRMLLILGQSGIGKSTLITWIIINIMNDINKILVYQFASDLKKVNWKSGDILTEILQTLNLEYCELENKVLVLDGFDEISMGGDNEKVLNQLYQELRRLNLIKRLTLIIMCRENYVWKLQRIECNYITLQTWNNEQIRSFCKIYTKKNASKISPSTISAILENREILGTPLILYMVLALNIVLEKSGSIVDVYDRIFTLEGGSIYDRCIINSEIKSLRFDSPHRISKYKQQIHEISQKIAFWMFEYESKEAFISQVEYEKICDEVIEEVKDNSEDIRNDFLIGNYFKITGYCERVGKKRLHFVHRSIYEYFVAEYIFSEICEMKSHQEIAGELGKLLKSGNLSKQILEFIKYKFNKYEKNNISNDIIKIFQLMLQYGMTYFTKEKYKKVIDREINIFSNMLKLVSLWNKALGKMDNEITYYLQYNNRSELKLEGINLEGADLNRVYLDSAYMNGAKLNGIKLQEAHLNGIKLIGAYLQNAVLNKANLEKADLSKADLIGAKLNKACLNEAELIGTRFIKAELMAAELIGAKLSHAELNGADLRGANLDDIILDGAYLRDAIFDEKQVTFLEKKYDLSPSKVYVCATDEVLSYTEYCKIK